MDNQKNGVESQIASPRLSVFGLSKVKIRFGIPNKF
jgi:hypothetical protein